MRKEKSALWHLIESVIGKMDRTLLWGPPGTGKTTIAQRMANKEHRSSYSITLTEDTPSAEIRGHFVPQNGKFIWQDGPAIRAWREGAVLVINEIDHAGPDCLTLLHAILDDAEVARITLPTSETVTPEPGFQVVATMNGHPNDLPEPLRDRFAVCIEVNEPHPGIIERLPDDLQNAASGTICKEDVNQRISARTWLGFAELREKVGEELAAKAVFAKRAQEVVDGLAIARGGK